MRHSSVSFGRLGRLGLLGLFVSASVVSAEPKPKDPPAAPQDPLAGKAFLAPIQVDSLTLTPIVATGAVVAGPNLLVLDEAMAKKLVKIKEVEDGEVNSLTIASTADQPVFLLAGEVIIGGKQDRIIGRNTIISAKTTQQVPVFCVEHGRWQGESKEFTTANALAHGRLRGKASFDAQQDVWNEVSAKNEARKTKSSTDTYRKVATQQAAGALGGGMGKRVDEALAKIPAADRARMVGYAVSLNGAVATVDLFDSPTLFAKLDKKLVGSYVTEAVDVAAKKDAKAPTADDVKTFMADADKAQKQRSYDTSFADTDINVGAHTGKSTVRYKAVPRKPGAKEDEAPAASAAPVFQTYSAH